jgi:hypothetical protein
MLSPGRFDRTSELTLSQPVYGAQQLQIFIYSSPGQKERSVSKYNQDNSNLLLPARGFGTHKGQCSSQVLTDKQSNQSQYGKNLEQKYDAALAFRVRIEEDGDHCPYNTDSK